MPPASSISVRTETSYSGAGSGIGIFVHSGTGLSIKVRHLKNTFQFSNGKKGTEFFPVVNCPQSDIGIRVSSVPLVTD
jgi:hypothetical protein